MEYEIVQIEKKQVVGISARTNNSDPNMGAVIGGLWERFYGQGVYQQIPDKANKKCLGIYSGYAGTETEDYDITVGCEVAARGALPEGAISMEIPSGKYARFVVRGHVHHAVADFWQKAWNMDLDRKFACDFEEYQEEGTMENSEIHIYISLK